MELTHFNEAGRAKMVDVGGKSATERVAKAHAKITMRADTLRLIQSGGVAKGDVLAVAQVAGIGAAKRTWELIPMCHPIALTGVDIEFTIGADGNPPAIEIIATVRCVGPTGVEMEALTAASVTALTIYDMCKAAQKDMEIGEIRLLEKFGGKSGAYRFVSSAGEVPNV
ncbi:MAG: cyclic pyranopterin monophosphate synthase MoaC [Oscillospiraceae bacterium]|nr:cyclic pyranopterin monophosphate synthase MoaC [Oscillospiraceae bacterium]